MGLFDLPAPLFTEVDGVLGTFLPPLLRLLLWGILAGLLTMLAYRRLSNQDRIGELKAAQKERQKQIAEFDGEMEDLLPLIFGTLRLGFRQLGLAIGPALLATIPVLFLVAWVAGAFGYHQPEPGAPVTIEIEPAAGAVSFQPTATASRQDKGWQLSWPARGQTIDLQSGPTVLLTLPTDNPVPIIHQKQWWNTLFGNPIGYLPDAQDIEAIHIGLPAQEFISAGPGWIRGWMFSFFLTFLLASIAFKLALKID